MLRIQFPLSFVALPSTRWPHHPSMTIAFVAFKLAVVLYAIWPSHLPCSHHAIIFKSACVNGIVRSLHSALAVCLTIHKLSFVHGTLWPLHGSTTATQSVLKDTLEGCAICPPC